MTLCQCRDCPALFVKRHARSYRCQPCQSKADTERKIRSQRLRNHAKRINEMADISEAEIEARFQAALREGRRVKREWELGRNYSWQYREPKS